MTSRGYQQRNSNHTFVRHRATSKLSILRVYIDNIILRGDGDEGIKQTKDFLAKEFEIKDLGGLKYFIGI